MGYSSKYYDPQKAKEYYEKNKKLKGRRRSTKGFTDNQKQAFSYVKDQINTEKKAKIKASSEEINATAKAHKEDIAERAKARRQAFSEDCKEKVAALREKLKGMSKEQKARMKEKIQDAIDKIKIDFSNKKALTSEVAKASKKAITENAKISRANKKADITAEYEQKLDNEYNAIKNG